MTGAAAAGVAPAGVFTGLGPLAVEVEPDPEPAAAEVIPEPGPAAEVRPGSRSARAVRAALEPA